MTRRPISRRKFLAGAAAAVGAPAAFSQIVPASVLGRAGRPAASERITVGLIGAGKRGGTLTRGIMRFDEVQVVAVAEVESVRRKDRRKLIEDHYAGKAGGLGGQYKGCATYNDFRELLARDDIDAVIIATPDHWHEIPVVAAARAGKDIYCEKPLSLTILEARRMADVVKKHKVVFQTGSQQRSEFGGRFHRACELVRNGRIGKVTEVYVNVGGPSRDCDLPEQAAPEGTDWNFWLGPAPRRAYHEDLCPRGVHNHFPAWRNYKEYSGGGMTDIGAHHFDIAQWGLGRDDSGPVEIIPPDGKNYPHLTYRYDDGTLMHHASKCGDENVNGVRFIGVDGVVEVNRSHFKTWPDAIGEEKIGDGEIRLYKASSHMGNWLECVRSRKETICPAEIGARSVTVCHLGNLAYWNKRWLHWDPKKWEFLGDAEANTWRDRPRRAPWNLEA